MLKNVKLKWAGHPGLKVLIMMTLLYNIVILAAQGLWMLMRSKYFIKMTRPQNIKITKARVCSWVIFINNFKFNNIRRPWAPKISLFCSELIMIKTFKPGGLGCPLLFQHKIYAYIQTPIAEIWVELTLISIMK